MSKVLGFVGSPRRRGNTHLLVARILDGARAAGAQVEMLFLNDLRIRECDGCHACWKGKPCAKKDDMTRVYARMIESDVLVFGTPVYWYGPTALMKGLVDRFVYFNCPENRARIRGKSALLAIPFEEEKPEAADLVVEFFRKSLGYLEIKLAGQVIAPGVSRKGDIRKRPGLLAEAFELGRRTVAGLSR